MSDVFLFDLDDGLASGACPLCFAVARDEERWLESFRREGRKDPETRRRFWAAGGFCKRHAWLLHHLVEKEGKGAAIADVYGTLADRDVAALDGVDRRRTRRERVLERHASCPACAWETEAVGRKASFLVELLATEAGRERYERSHGLCLPHLRVAVDAAADDRELALFLIRNWQNRLAEVRARLAQSDRERDAWTEIIRRYVGEPS